MDNMLVKLGERIALLKSECEKSAAQHNALVGALQEAQNLYQLYMTENKATDCNECSDSPALEATSEAQS
jgi:hypothetical protein